MIGWALYGINCAIYLFLNLGKSDFLFTASGSADRTSCIESIVYHSSNMDDITSRFI